MFQFFCGDWINFVYIKTFSTLITIPILHSGTYTRYSSLIQSIKFECTVVFGMGEGVFALNLVTYSSLTVKLQPSSAGCILCIFLLLAACKKKDYRHKCQSIYFYYTGFRIPVLHIMHFLCLLMTSYERFD